uniref:Uncharacterized protein n=1 Tax=Musa acuminata subsp. malaccensis TaxID=214687 RepID=A0A804HM16_MUSAM
MRMVSQKNLMVIKIAQSRGLVDFLSIISKIQNIDHTQHIIPVEVV